MTLIGHYSTGKQIFASLNESIQHMQNWAMPNPEYARGFGDALNQILINMQKQESSITYDQGVRPEVMRFSRLMESKLKDNDYKGGWSDDDPINLLNKLVCEVWELQNAINEATDPYDIVSECVDVANFAMMLADNLMPIRQHSQEPQP